MILILGTIQFDVAQATEAHALAAAISAHSVKEEGCVHYSVGFDVNNPDRLQVTEFWRDTNAFQAHLETPHVKAFREALAKLRVYDRVIKRWRVDELAEL